MDIDNEEAPGMNYHGKMINLPAKPTSIVGNVSAWAAGHRFARHQAAELALEADREIERLRDIAKQALTVIKAVQDYEQPTDPTYENALTMCEHEVFDFEVDAALAAINTEERG